jgi:hypothetical protein
MRIVKRRCGRVKVPRRAARSMAGTGVGHTPTTVTHRSDRLHHIRRDASRPFTHPPPARVRGETRSARLPATGAA